MLRHSRTGSAELKPLRQQQRERSRLGTGHLGVIVEASALEQLLPLRRRPIE